MQYAAKRDGAISAKEDAERQDYLQRWVADQQQQASCPPRMISAGKTVLDGLGRRLRESREPVRIARASGHGVGKSTVAAWVVIWALSTMHDARVVVTANTETQLRTKTWPEIIKWLRLAIHRRWSPDGTRGTPLRAREGCR